MKAGSHSMPEVCCEARATIQLFQIEVSPTHPLLLLKRALPWEAITEVMTRYWRQNGKNVRLKAVSKTSVVLSRFATAMWRTSLVVHGRVLWHAE